MGARSIVMGIQCGGEDRYCNQIFTEMNEHLHTETCVMREKNIHLKDLKRRNLNSLGVQRH